MQDWWDGDGATGNWFGLGKPLWDCGLSVRGDYQGNYYGNSTGGYRTASAFDEQIKLSLTYDFAQVFGIEGIKAYSILRYRDGNPINNIAGAANGFDPSPIQGGRNFASWHSIWNTTVPTGRSW